MSSADILSAHFIPSEEQELGTLVLHQKGGREHHVSIALSSARAFLRASKLGPRHQATRITSTTAPLGCLGVIGYFLLVPAAVLGFLGTSTLPLVLDLVGFSREAGYYFPLAILMAFAFFSVGDILTDLVKLVAGNTIVLGTDGIRWGKLRRKFITYADIASLRVVRPLGAFSNHQLIIEAKDGVTEHKIRLRGFVKDASKIVEERLRGALEQSADILMPQLDRQGRSDEEWREALRELVKHRGDYRKAAVPKERVRALLQDPAAPPEQRLGAAVALVEAEDPEARRILVSISENIADPELIDAIDSLAEEAEEFEVEEVAIEAEAGHSVSA